MGSKGNLGRRIVGEAAVCLGSRRLLDTVYPYGTGDTPKLHLLELGRVYDLASGNQGPLGDEYLSRLRLAGKTGCKIHGISDDCIVCPGG